jgi:hypothetical protein
MYHNSYILPTLTDKQLSLRCKEQYPKKSMPFQNQTETKTTIATLKNLYPHLSNEELKEAEETIKRYVQIVTEIAESIRQSSELQARYEELKEQYKKQLTESEESSSLKTVEY